MLLEIGMDHCCYARLDEASKRFLFVRYFSFDDQESEGNIGSLLDTITDVPSRVVIGSAYAPALLVPQQFFKQDFLLPQLVYDLPAQKYLSDAVPEWQLVTTYAIPSAIYDQLNARFPGARYCHVYSPALKFYNGYVAEDQVDIHFSMQVFRVLVKKDNAVQLVQTYSYKTPLDVVYYLLKICYEFKMDQAHLFMIVSGLIDKDSALYQELHHYFTNLHFAAAPDYTLPEAEHPHYYFTSLYNMAACAS